MLSDIHCSTKISSAAWDFFSFSAALLYLYTRGFSRKSSLFPNRVFKNRERRSSSSALFHLVISDQIFQIFSPPPPPKQRSSYRRCCHSGDLSSFRIKSPQIFFDEVSCNLKREIIVKCIARNQIAIGEEKVCSGLHWVGGKLIASKILATTFLSKWSEHQLSSFKKLFQLIMECGCITKIKRVGGGFYQILHFLLWNLYNFRD